MRTGIVSTLTVAAVAAAAPVAHAGARADYKQMFTTPVPGASTGTDTQILYKNPSDPEAKPIAVRQERFTFPRGTRYDEGVVPDCTATDVEIMLFGRSACPEESWTGGGQGDTMMTGFQGAREMPIDVDGWDDHGDTRLFGRDHQSGIGFVTRAHREGQVITVEVPPSPGAPSDGAALRFVHNVFAPRSLGRRAYIRTPRRCPSTGFWRFKAAFTFADGVVEHDTYRMACRRG